jgi:hypothetical protein
MPDSPLLGGKSVGRNMNKLEYLNIGSGVRSKDGSITGLVGMICNITLFIVKFSIGYITKSIAVTGDAFNNLSDAGVSLFAMAGFRKSINNLAPKLPPPKGGFLGIKPLQHE